MRNIFTVDTEDWFHANYTNNLFQNEASIQSTVEANTDVYLKYFAECGTTATFFVLGFVAEQHPALVRRIAEAGHEIASHGYGHQLVYKQTPEEFRQDIRKSKSLLENVIGKPVWGYRAPSWSITENSLWALEILTQEGFRYDSSIFPFKNFLYGIDGAPRFPFPSKLYCKTSDLVEIPPSTVRIPGLNMPFSGGFYFRALPFLMIKICAHKVNREGEPVIFYLHPREIDPEQPRLKLSMRDSFIHYFGIRNCEKKLTRVLKEFPCVSIQQMLTAESK
ncbi:DUF3473 domain-containing protein [Agathobaculum sp. NTUH-O15-33]|uniref:XrtA system polysaccharide deacetylase n=1 Tax=Agathobaculum sp. NTUH-O15-33 TaxID=3079302 RepID=UPI002958CBBE|nr:XrtA system polysaccharide deacetylase [Agathobaculum sp. NTUH-O15-33]WNX84086.1 DUF3473 domain-containing protein [Agathobaculum sp. NTUH-O15-33]